MSRSAVAAEPGLENGHGPFGHHTFAPPPQSHMRSGYSSSSSSSVAHMQSRSGSQFSTFSQPSRSSASTQDTSISTHALHPFRSSTPSQANGGPVSASNNVINRVADKETSLFQICINLRNRLKGVPGFEEQLLEVEEADGADEDEDRDPVSILWNTFRRGYPLMTIYNALQPKEPLFIDDNKVAEARRQKMAAFKFLQACVSQLKFPTEECFIITDLYGEDTSGFVKVTKVVNRVADLLVERGLLESYENNPDKAGFAPNAKRTHREHIVDELVRTERTYVQHLEVLQAFKKLVEQRGIISGDAIHDMFLNLNALLDFQRRFLIRVEQINNTPDSQQNWGALFQNFGRGFGVYEPYIANQRKCEETVMREFEKLRQAGGELEMRQLVESPTHLTSFLLKPFQRLSKYPLLLKELRDKGDLDEFRRTEISKGMETISSVLDRTNDFIDREDRMDAVRLLKESVDDWKNHSFEAFGELLLHGNHIVIKGDATQSEKEYQMYLFEHILLCCKEANPYKQKNRLMNKSQISDKRGRPKLILKGRIFMQNVTETILLAKPGSYTCQIFWRGDDAIEYFIIRFSTEDTMKKWASAIEKQRKICKDRAAREQPQATSETEFNWIREQGQVDNPYAAEEGYLDGTDLDDPATYGYLDESEYPASRNGSNSSLRSRSTTGESGPPAVQPRGASLKQPPIGLVGPALTLRTQMQSNGISPGDRGGNSYFAGGGDSPISSRTSSSSFNMGFARQPPPPGWQHEEHPRFTAPALGRTTSKDIVNGKQNNGQPLPMHPAALNQTRMRSASSPDIHTNAANLARRAAQQNAPPVPNLPSHFAGQAIDRSQDNSPIYAENIPPRITSQSSAARKQINTQGQTHHHAQYSVDGAASIMSNDAPSQIKVKVKVPSEGSTMTLVVGFNITYQTLKDRIDAKLQRHTNLSLAAGSVKLKYLSDDDYVSIQTDEDVQTAFETWREQQQEQGATSHLEEIELYCLR